MKEKIVGLLKQLNLGFVGREDVLKSTLLTLLAGENILLIGPPGTGKSMLARRVSEVLTTDTEQSNYFEYLLTKFSTPEEIFGPLSLTDLKQDRFHRKTAGYLPTVQVAFLDEIFKASSSILNALLTILNERKYHNGTVVEDIPLHSLVAASNELPIGQDELSALYDRFLVRKFVDYVDEQNISQLFNLPQQENIKVENQPSVTELTDVKEKAKRVLFSDEVQQVIQQICKKFKQEFKENKDEVLSDRRLVKVLHLLRISALTNGRQEVDFSDVMLLKDCLWNHPDNAEKVLEIIRSEVIKFDRVVPVPEGQMPKAQHHKKTVRRAAALNSVIKGYKGSGTEEDPILIETIQDLAGLQRSEIGQQGYYFLQAADIDGAALDKWFSIDFKGNYDGNNHLIIFKNMKLDACAIFKNIKKSKFIDLTIDGISLAENIETSLILGCYAKNSIAQRVNKSKVQQCQSNTTLILESVSHTNIMDCLVIFNKNYGASKCGIAESIEESKIENCFVAGELSINTYENYLDHLGYMGLGSIIKNSFISNNALGKIISNNKNATVSSRFFQKTTTNMSYSMFAGVFSSSSATKDTTVARNNISVDSNQGESDPNGADGLTVPAALFNQKYFEDHLGWDFKNIWQWDTQQDIPVLRPFLSNKATTQPEHKANEGLLITQQLRANIWL